MGKALLRVGGARGISLLVSFFCAMLATRLVLGHFGTDTLASVSLISTLVSLLPFADLGLGVVLVNATVAAREGFGVSDLRHGLQVILIALASTGTIVIVVGLIMGRLQLWSRVLGAASSHAGDPNVILPWFCVAFALYLFGGPALRILFGLGKADMVMALQSLPPALNLLGTYGVIRLGTAPWPLVFFPICSAILISVVFWVLAVKGLHCAGIYLRQSDSGWASWNFACSFLATGRGGLLLGTGTALLLQTDRLIASRSGVAAVELAAIAVALPLFTATQSLLGAFGAHLWPRFSALRIRGELRWDIIARSGLVSMTGGMLLILLFAFGVPIYGHLVGFSGASLIPLGIVLGTLLFAQSTTLTPSSLLTDSSYLRFQGLLAMVVGLLKVCLSVFLVTRFSVVGSPLASAIVVLLLQSPALWIVAYRAYRRL